MKYQGDVSQAAIETELVAIVSRLLALEPAKIPVSSALQGGDIPFDSLGIAEFMMEVEEAFDMEVSETAHAEMFPGRPPTIASLAEVIVALKKK